MYLKKKNLLKLIAVSVILQGVNISLNFHFLSKSFNKLFIKKNTYNSKELKRKFTFVIIFFLSSIQFQNLLLLNPRVQTKCSVVPSSVTKTNKKHWKRNGDKSSCQVSTFLLISI